MFYFSKFLLPALLICGSRLHASDSAVTRYIQQKRKVLYLNLLTSGKLNGYLADIDTLAEDMLSRLVKQMAEREGITEKLKAEQPMKWVGKMNTLREAATEIVNAKVIFA